MMLQQVQSSSTTGEIITSDHKRSKKLIATRRLLLVLIILTSGAILLIQSLAAGHISAEHVYDDGVYFAASLNVVHGIIPYKDFVFVQPPLITVWLAPLSILAHFTGTRWAFQAARLFTDLVMILDICLVAFLLRKRSTIRMLLGVGTMAFSSNIFWASRTILIEPYLIALCLAALVAMTENEAITSSARRMWIAGILFGLAGATKIWAIFPMLVALAIIWKIQPRQRTRLVGGTAIGFFASVVPFAVLAPLAFLKEVVITQMLRAPNGLGLFQRLLDLTGIPNLYYLKYINTFLADSVLIAIYLLIAILILNSLRTWKLYTGTHLELLSTASTALVGLSFVLAHSYFKNYGGFITPYLAISLTTITYPFKPSTSSKKLLSIGIITFVLFTFAWQDFQLAISPGVAAINQVNSQTESALGTGGCLWAADPALAILANRYTGDQANCPHTVDWGGTELLLIHSYKQSATLSNVQLQNDFLEWLKESNRLEVSKGAFANAATEYLNKYFHPVTYRSAGRLPTVFYFRNKVLPVITSARSAVKA